MLKLIAVMLFWYFNYKDRYACSISQDLDCPIKYDDNGELMHKISVASMCAYYLKLYVFGVVALGIFTFNRK